MDKLEDRIKELEDKYMVAMDASNYLSAKELIQQIMTFRIHEKDYINEGVCLHFLNQDHNALISFQKATEINPKEYVGWDYLGKILERDNQYKKAVEVYKAGLKHNPQEAILNENLGIILFHHKELDEAKYYLSKATEINPKNDKTWFLLGTALKKLDYIEEAVDSLYHAIKINPGNSSYWESYAELMEIKSLDRKAINAYKKAIEIAPDNDELWNALGINYINIGEYDKAVDAQRTAVKLNPQSAKHQGNLGLSLNMKGENKEALQCYMESVRLDPRLELGWNNFARTLCELDCYDEAMTRVKEGLEKSETGKDLLLFLKSGIEVVHYGRNDDAKNTIAEIQDEHIQLLAWAQFYVKNHMTISSIEYAFEAMKKYTCYNDKEYMSKALGSISEKIVKDAISNHITVDGFKNLSDILKENYTHKLSENSGYILSALFDAAQDELEYIKLTKELFRDVIKNHMDLLVPIGVTSKNPVNIINQNIISQNLYVIKSSSKIGAESLSELEKEYRITRLVNTLTKKTTGALMLEQGYMLEKRILKPSLREIVEDADTEEVDRELIKCVDTLSDIHYKIRPKKISSDKFEMNYYDAAEDKEIKIELPKYNLMGELKRRFADRIGSGASKVMEEYSEILQPIILTEQFIHADTFKGNWLSGGNIIDWDRASIGDPMIDLVQLVNDVDFSELNKEELAKYYIQKIGLDPNKAMKKYEILCIHDSLCNIGTSLDPSRGNLARVQKYYEQVIQQTKKYPQLQRAINNYLTTAGIIHPK